MEQQLKAMHNPLWVSGLFYTPGVKTHLDIGSNTGNTLRGLSKDTLTCIESYKPASDFLSSQGFAVCAGDALAVAGDMVNAGKRYERITALDFVEHLPRIDGEKLLDLVETLATKEMIFFVPIETDELVNSLAYKTFMAKIYSYIPLDQHSLQTHQARWTTEDFQARGYDVYIFNDFHFKGFDAFFATKYRSESDRMSVRDRFNAFAHGSSV